MIGFKTSDDFSFDDCIVFLSEHDNANPSWNEINQRYQRLLKQLQKEDESAFNMCRTTIDYKKYLDSFQNLRGALNYAPSHKAEAEEYIRKYPIQPPTPKKRLLASFLVDADKRNFFTNLVLYLLLLASLIASVIQIPGVIRTYQYFSEDGWSFIEAYGKGFMPGFLLSALAFVGVSKIIKWRKSGLTILVVSFIIILLPTICNEFLEFICFSVPCVLGVALLWGILKIKKNGISTWDKCKAEPRWANYVLHTILFIWLFMIAILPPIVGLYTGFRSNIYSNGMRCLDAHLNSSPYYSYDLYQRILLGADLSDDVFEKQNTAEIWLSNARYLNDINNREEGRFEDEFSEELLFLNKLIFIAKNKSNQDVIDYISLMKDKIDMSMVFKYLNGDKYVMGEYEYYKPNQEKITSLLNQVGIYYDAIESEACEVVSVEESTYDNEVAK